MTTIISRYGKDVQSVKEIGRGYWYGITRFDIVGFSGIFSINHS
jgi:hypothetical protein